MKITLEYELDEWDWRGSSRSLELNSEDFDGLSDEQIASAVYQQIWEDGRQHIHFIYPETDVVRDIKEAIAAEAESRE